MLDDCREAAAAAAVFLLLPARRAEPPLACLYSASDFYFLFFSGESSNFWRQVSTFLKGQATITSSVFFFQFCEFQSLAIFLGKKTLPFFSNLCPKKRKKFQIFMSPSGGKFAQKQIPYYKLFFSSFVGSKVLRYFYKNFLL